MASCGKGARTLKIGDSLTAGRRHTLRGTAGSDLKTVLLLFEKDNLGNEDSFVAELYDSRKSRMTLPTAGAEVVFDGVLQPGRLTGTDYSYKSDGSRTEARMHYMQFEDCHIR